ncbi:MAG: hypothetical protein GYB65_01100 [Chloroflexi bacterium]|nr:hypothetical protein [Chloroflexota bacterium]
MTPGSTPRAETLWLPARHGHQLATYHVFQGDTNHCGPSVATMAVNFWHGKTVLDAQRTAHAMNWPRMGWGIPPLVIRRVPNWATFPWGIADMLRRNGLQARWRWLATETHIQEALAAGRIPMPIFGEPLRRRGWRPDGWGHVAVVVGWSPDRMWFVDSSERTAPTSRPRAEFLRLWHNMGQLLVEGW